MSMLTALDSLFLTLGDSKFLNCAVSNTWRWLSPCIDLQLGQVFAQYLPPYCLENLSSIVHGRGNGGSSSQNGVPNHQNTGIVSEHL